MPAATQASHIGFAEVAAVGQCFGLAQFIRQSRYLVEHRRKLLLVVGRLHHVDRNHQHAACGDRGLRIVALLEPPATGMMRDSSSVRLIWSVGKAPDAGGDGGRPPVFLPLLSSLALRAASLASCSACSRA
jgi:hypothetical protein